MSTGSLQDLYTCVLFASDFLIYMASQNLTTFKDNYLMRGVNLRRFLSALLDQTAPP